MAESIHHGTTDDGLRAQVHRSHERNGRGDLARRAARKLRSTLLMIWRRVAQHRNHVFVHDPNTERVQAPAGLLVSRYARLAEVPPPIAVQLRAMRGSGTLDADRWELEHGAVLWVGLIDGQVVGTSTTRRGRHFRKWFVSLADEDIVIFRNATAPQFRGMGICPAMMQRIIHEELESGGRAYVDCRVYNRPSIRSIEKAGFRLIATKRPLKRGDAVG